MGYNVLGVNEVVESGARHQADRMSLRGGLHQQTTPTIVMVEPALFRHNFDTARDNKYQERPANMTEDEVDALAQGREAAFAAHQGLRERTEELDRDTHQRASQEFANMVAVLKGKLIQVIVVPDVIDHDTPDSVFPNNPLSLHPEDGGIAIRYPMRNSSRRAEKRLPITDVLTSEFGFKIGHTVDFSDREAEGHFVEGTGSMVLDRTNKLSYASLSQRTTHEGVEAFADTMGYRAITFRTFDRIRQTDVYHANVVMSVGSQFAVICAEAIIDPVEREAVLDSLHETGKDIIEITTEQMNGFAGNILEVRNANGNPVIVMSETAYDTFTPQQIETLSHYGEIVSTPIPTIEKHGGGSARCMMLEVHLPKEELH
ncbi:MAG: arginine deiminase-related protein [Patescibacteria group bacterium]|mgnify:FL=1